MRIAEIHLDPGVDGEGDVPCQRREHVLLACHADADWPAGQLLTWLVATEERWRAEILPALKQG